MKDAVKKNLLKFSSFGKVEGRGISRVFGSEAMKEAMAAMMDYFKECGMECFVDSVGNVHGIYRAPEDEGGEILLGSHLDTVQEGGMFDGLLGIIAAAESVRRIREENKRLPFALHVVATNGEEGNDLGGTFGSRCMAGLVSTEDAGYREKLKTFGYTPEDIKNARMDFSPVKCYLELHIEQGKTLDESKEDIGIVTGIVGLQRYEITIRGEANHSGTTMMEYRKDALVDAADLIVRGDELAKKWGRQLVATFQKVEIHPNVVAVISDEVKMILEVRNLEEEQMEGYLNQVRERLSEYADAEMTPVVQKSPVRCGKDIMDAVERSCQSLNVTYRQMPSGATHDGNAIGSKVPIGMIFVPSKKGVSHSKEEWTDWDACGKGAEVLYRTILNLRGGTV